MATAERPIPKELSSDGVTYLEPGVIAQALFNTFRFSQGDVDLQEKIIYYISSSRPGWRIDFGEKAKHLEVAQRKFGEFLIQNKGKYHMRQDRATIRETVKTWYLRLGSELQAGKDHYLERLPMKISHQLIKRDYEYRERMREGSGGRGGSYADPHLSQVVHFGLLGNTTGMEVFDEMFVDVRNHILGEPLSRQDERMLGSVISSHNATHPDMQVDLRQMRAEFSTVQTYEWQ